MDRLEEPSDAEVLRRANELGNKCVATLAIIGSRHHSRIVPADEYEALGVEALLRDDELGDVLRKAKKK